MQWRSQEANVTQAQHGHRFQHFLVVFQLLHCQLKTCGMPFEYFAVLDPINTCVLTVTTTVFSLASPRHSQARLTRARCYHFLSSFYSDSFHNNRTVLRLAKVKFPFLILLLRKIFFLESENFLLIFLQVLDHILHQFVFSRAARSPKLITGSTMDSGKHQKQR